MSALAKTGSEPTQTQVSVGTDMAEVILNDVESDIGLALHHRAAQNAKQRIAKLHSEWTKMLDDLRRQFVESDATFARLYIQGSREDLLKAFMNVSRAIAATPDGRDTIQREVDRLIDRAIADLNALEKPGSLDPLARPAGKKKS